MRLYHNPKCSKSRHIVEILKSREIEFEEHKYLELGILKEDLELLSSLPNIIRTVEKEYKLVKDNISNKKGIMVALSQFPRLLQRPILVKGGKAIICRPPEIIKDFLGD
tara:strand:- start:478 stop:804 length:327 start_codon:yes stop_codon:yes gene_type:complete